ncbi:hypothetical protein BHE74_00056753 [Ensete ventricosum]|nr:hypothetical protein BHE74_00056753 [Ensete ventricosum]
MATGPSGPIDNHVAGATRRWVPPPKASLPSLLRWSPTAASQRYCTKTFCSIQLLVQVPSLEAYPLLFSYQNRFLDLFTASGIPPSKSHSQFRRFMLFHRSYTEELEAQDASLSELHQTLQENTREINCNSKRQCLQLSYHSFFVPEAVPTPAETAVNCLSLFYFDTQKLPSSFF